MLMRSPSPRSADPGSIPPSPRGGLSRALPDPVGSPSIPMHPASRKGRGMPAPPVEQWRERTDAQPLNRALGVRAEEIAEGFARYRVVRVPGSAAGIDGNDAPEGVSTFAITTAADL